MVKRFYLIILLTYLVHFFAFSHINNPNDSAMAYLLDTNQNKYNKQVDLPKLSPSYKQRKLLVTAAQVSAYGGSLYTLGNEWYGKQGFVPFHFFNDNGEYLQMDKCSHTFGSYIGGNLSMQVWKWAGIKKNNYVWIGGTTGLAYMTIIEILDGFGKGWGFSKGDYLANMIGTATCIGQELLWDDQRVVLKYSTHINNYEDPRYNNYLNRTYGTSGFDRYLKDYNAQTYWASANIKAFLPKANVPKWLNIAVGYGTANMNGALWDGVLYNDNTLVFPANYYQRYRRYYLAPDIDFTRITTKNKYLKAALYLLNIVKFPTPSLEYSQGSLKWNWLHF